MIADVMLTIADVILTIADYETLYIFTQFAILIPQIDLRFNFKFLYD